jgi:hypothetical protein
MIKFELIWAVICNILSVISIWLLTMSDIAFSCRIEDGLGLMAVVFSLVALLTIVKVLWKEREAFKN